jgi:hypothetical protein
MGRAGMGASVKEVPTVPYAWRPAHRLAGFVGMHADLLVNYPYRERSVDEICHEIRTR